PGGWVVPARDLAVDRVNDAFTLPADDRSVAMLPKLVRDVGVRRALREHADNVLALLDGVLDLPVHPFALRGVVRDEHDQGAGPLDAGSEDLTLDVVLVLRGVGL